MATSTEKQQSKTNRIKEQFKTTPPALTAVEPKAEKRPPLDVTELTTFLDTVFHSGLLADDDDEPLEHIMLWRTTGKPGLPMSVDAAARRVVSSTGTSAAWYYGTAAGRPDENNQLRNKKNLFSSLHVVVLDDIGTKVKIESLPQEFRKPSYIIESSPGNFQYGLVLEEPIEDYNVAGALIQLVYTSGVTDAGGRMPGKLVRLPFGINGKAGEKHDFPVTLKHLSDRRYTPAQILKAIDADTTWPEVAANPASVDKNLKTSSIGAVAWQPLTTAITTDGATDALLDWFEQNEFVQSYGADWVTVTCPWAHLHTSGDDSAGYSPLGFGEGRWRNIRSFKCFHEHCADRTASELVATLHETAQIDTLYPVYDPSWVLRKRLVFEAENHAVLDLDLNNPAAMPRKIETAGIVYCQTAPNLDPKKAPVKLFNMYRDSPEKLVVNGVRYLPAGGWPFAESDDGLFLNAFSSPCHGSGGYDLAAGKAFVDHVEYLCDGDGEAFRYVLNWLVCLIHDPTFRGNAVLMTTPAFGVGRDTLVAMLNTVLGAANTTTITPKQMLGPYNEYLEHQLVVCSEMTDGGAAGDTGYYRFYEHIKDLIDPGTRAHQINRKYGKMYKADVYTSFLFFSNHADAVRLAEHDRRIYVVSNPSKPQLPEYYTNLRALMAGKDFGRDVYRYVKERFTPDYQLANKPAPMSKAKATMFRASRSAGEVGVEAIIDVLDCALISPQHVSNLIEGNASLVDSILQGKSPAQHLKYFRKLIALVTAAESEKSPSLRLRLGGAQVRGRVARGREPHTEAEWEAAKAHSASRHEWALANPDTFAQEVLSRMDEIWDGANPQ